MYKKEKPRVVSIYFFRESYKLSKFEFFHKLVYHVSLTIIWDTNAIAQPLRIVFISPTGTFRIYFLISLIQYSSQYIKNTFLSVLSLDFD